MIARKLLSKATKQHFSSLPENPGSPLHIDPVLVSYKPRLTKLGNLRKPPSRKMSGVIRFNYRKPSRRLVQDINNNGEHFEQTLIDTTRHIAFSNHDGMPSFCTFVEFFVDKEDWNTDQMTKLNVFYLENGEIEFSKDKMTNLELI